jgi:hypothetical protein
MVEQSSSAEALRALRRLLPAAVELLKADNLVDLASWVDVLDLKLLPRLEPRFPLVAAVCGGGSAGKSTLFNSLVGRGLSPTGGKAGLNRRVLAAVRDDHVTQKGFMQSLSQAFGGRLTPLTDPGMLTTPGDPVYWQGPSQAPATVVLLDTPDIDTGAKGEYHNREQARQSLESADAFIYIFTNATYNNRDNTDFIATMLTGMGVRPCFLVYRVYPSYSDAEVREHALTVAQNIYGADYAPHLLGMFRADEDNAVAAGERAMRVQSIDQPDQTLAQALAALDPVRMRAELIRSMAGEVIGQASRMHHHLEQTQSQVGEYVAALEQVQQKCVQRALSHFPTDRVLGRFAEIWQAGDPAHIRIMRGTGKVVEWPFRLVTSALRHRRKHRSGEGDATGDPEARLDIDLLDAATVLYQQTVSDPLQVDGRSLVAPAVVHAAQERMRGKDWKAALTHIHQQREVILSWSEQLEADLRRLADELRGRMGFVDQVRQTFAALLNVLPATAAITYILSTGDPVGAAGIKVKLTGLLGLKDLYALIAIPATAGIKKADQKQLELMLAPVARTWLAHKFNEVQTLFEQRITGEVLEGARTAHAQSADVIRKVARTLDQARKLSL